MGNRDTYDQSLRDLDDKILAMAGHAADAVESAMGALENSNLAAAQAVVEGDDRIDREEHAIEHLCLGLIACQQPVAGDLRKISTAMKVVTDLERLGDAAEDIAEIVISGQVNEGEELLRDMAASTIKMVTESVDAYVKHDTMLAEKVIAEDDIVDGWFDRVKHTLIRRMTTDPGEGERAVDLLMIAKYFERIGDHAVNVAQWVIFSVTGTHKEG